MSDDNNGPPIWLISFTDVIALMLTFFVLLYAMSSPDSKKWSDKIGASDYAFEEFSGPVNQSGNQEGINISRVSFQNAENLKYLKIVFSEILNNKNYQDVIKVEDGRDSLVLSFSKWGTDKSKDLLKNLVPLLNSLDNRIAILKLESNLEMFKAGQKIGNDLKSYGYKHRFDIITSSNVSLKHGEFAILVYPHTGQRITR